MRARVLAQSPHTPAPHRRDRLSESTGIPAPPRYHHHFGEDGAARNDRSPTAEATRVLVPSTAPVSAVPLCAALHECNTVQTT